MRITKRSYKYIAILVVCALGIAAYAGFFDSLSIKKTVNKNVNKSDFPSWGRGYPDFTARFDFVTVPSGATVDAWLWDLAAGPNGYGGYPPNANTFFDTFHGVTPCSWKIDIKNGQSLYGMFTTVAWWNISKPGYISIVEPDEIGFLYGVPVWNRQWDLKYFTMKRKDSVEIQNLKLNPSSYLNKVVTVQGICKNGVISDNSGSSIAIKYSSVLVGSYILTGTFVYSSGRYCINVQTATKK